MDIKQLIFVLLISLVPVSVHAQDEIWLLNGQKKKVSALEFSEDNLLIRYTNEKGKSKLLSTKELFSATPEGDREYVFYQPTDEMSIENMKEYMSGEVAANVNYKAKGAFYSALGLGVVSPFVLGKISIIIPLTYGITIGQIKPKNNKLAINNDSVYFIKGYKRVVKKKRLISSLLGGSLGLIIGTTSVYIVNK